MKYNRFFAKISFPLLVCAGWMLASCAKGPELRVSTNYMVIDSFPDSLFIDISANVHWTVTIKQTDNWLRVTPMEGKGNQTITVIVFENEKWTERTASIAISGEEVPADTIRIVQTAAFDVAEAIVDENFRTYCLGEFDKSPKDGKLSLKEAKGVDKISARGLNISSLAGIEYFTGLLDLDCSGNNIKSINLNKNKEIRKLDCSNNPIDQMDVSALAKLTVLYIVDAKLQNIDVSANTELEILNISNNQISSLDVSNNPKLGELSCNVNNLSSLDLKKNTILAILYCTDNKLNSLDVSSNKKLERLWCNNNLLSNLDVTSNTALQILSCSKNSIKSLNLNNNTALIQLLCESCQLDKLDVSKNLNLTDLRCTSNRLAGYIDVRNNKLLKYLYLQNNPLLTEIWVWQGFNTTNANYQKDATANYVFY